MSMVEDLQDGLSMLEAELAQVCTWKAVEYPCVANRLKRGVVLVVGGKEETIALTLNIRKTVLPTPLTSGGAEVTSLMAMSTATAATAPPSAGHFITFQAVVYRVVAVSDGPQRGFYEIDLADKNR